MGKDDGSSADFDADNNAFMESAFSSRYGSQPILKDKYVSAVFWIIQRTLAAHMFL